jgi:hypothetical protein
MFMFFASGLAGVRESAVSEPCACRVEVDLVKPGSHEAFEGLGSSGPGGMAAVRVTAVAGRAEGYLAGISEGDVLFLRRGRGWLLTRLSAARFLLAPDSGEAGPAAAATGVSVAGIMRKMPAGE